MGKPLSDKVVEYCWVDELRLGFEQFGGAEIEPLNPPTYRIYLDIKFDLQDTNRRTLSDYKYHMMLSDTLEKKPTVNEVVNAFKDNLQDIKDAIKAVKKEKSGYEE